MRTNRVRFTMSVRIAFGMMPHEFAVFCADLRLPFSVDGYKKTDS